jgi:CHAT domain-containing protein
MRVLVVAPGSELDNVEDWVSSARGNELSVLNGVVNKRELLSCISGGKFQIIHFAVHGCRDAIELSDKPITKAELRNALNAAGSVELVVLAACKSSHIANQLYQAGVPRVLCWPGDVSDRVAALWASTFYSSLRLSGDIWSASQTAEETLIQLGEEPPLYLNGRLAKLEAEVVAVRRQLVGALAVYGVIMLFMLVWALAR